MRARTLARFLCLALIVEAGEAEAGSNVGSAAWLSVPSDAEAAAQDDRITNFPVQVNLSGLRDARELAIQLRWYPFVQGGRCFQIVSSPRSATSGWAIQERPNAAFDGDSTYTGTIHFPEGVAKNLVTFWFSRGACEGYADGMRVVLAEVYARDSEGIVDAVRAARETLVVARSSRDPVSTPPPSVRPPDPKPIKTAQLDLKVSPTPTQGLTQLTFTTPPLTAFGLAVFDVGGRLVRKIDATPGDDGRGTGIWDLHDANGLRVPRGIYFAKISTVHGNVSKQIVVAR